MILVYISSNGICLDLMYATAEICLGIDVKETLYVYCLYTVVHVLWLKF